MILNFFVRNMYINTMRGSENVKFVINQLLNRPSPAHCSSRDTLLDELVIV